MNRHYQAFKRPEGVQLIKVSNEAVYITGVYQFKTEILTLFNPEKRMNREWFPKATETGHRITKKGKNEEGKIVDFEVGAFQFIERNITSELDKTEAEWFFGEYVQNAEEAKAWLSEEPVEVPDLFPEGQVAQDLVTEDSFPIGQTEMEVL